MTVVWTCFYELTSAHFQQKPSGAAQMLASMAVGSDIFVCRWRPCLISPQPALQTLQACRCVWRQHGSLAIARAVLVTVFFPKISEGTQSITHFKRCPIWVKKRKQGDNPRAATDSPWNLTSGGYGRGDIISVLEYTLHPHKCGCLGGRRKTDGAAPTLNLH